MAETIRPNPVAPSAAPRTPAEAAKAAGSPPAGAPSFAEVLKARQGLADASGYVPLDSTGIRFSGHAQARIQSRSIGIQPAHLERLRDAVDRASSKGAKDALVLMDQMAMVVSVKNRTVVTVVDQEGLKQNVFTNIDSAVIA